MARGKWCAPAPCGASLGVGRLSFNEPLADRETSETFIALYGGFWNQRCKHMASFTIFEQRHVATEMQAFPRQAVALGFHPFFNNSFMSSH